MHSMNVKIMETECSAIMLVTMNNTTQLYILHQTNTTKFIITTAHFVTVLPEWLSQYNDQAKGRMA